MYDKVKYMGKTLAWWRDNVFKGAFNLGELYRMMKDGIGFNKLALVKVE